MLQPFSQSAFTPVLHSSEALAVSDEQKMWIRKVLDIASSDAQFAAKAYDAIVFILSSGSVEPIILTSLNPASATLGSESFTISVTGTGFTPTSVILWNGSEEPTTFVSETELTTVVNMSTAQVAIDIPVMVADVNGSVSPSLIFSILPAVQADSVKSTKSKKAVKEEDVFSSFSESKK